MSVSAKGKGEGGKKRQDKGGRGKGMERRKKRGEEELEVTRREEGRASGSREGETEVSSHDDI